MANSGSANEKWLAFRQKMQTGLGKTGSVLQAIGNILRIIASYVVRLRKVFMAIPVVVGAVYLAQYNYDHLPSRVGIDLLATGQYAQMISKDAAIMGPLVVTAACLLLMFCSRRTMYPWIISIFSLVLPVLILVTNIFPA